MSENRKKRGKRLNSAVELGRFMNDYYHELDHAAKTGDKKIAWCTSVGPAEILRAMGYLVYFPETHSAMLGAARMATDLIPRANTIGFSPEICSYLTADIGAYLAGVSPLKKVYGDIQGPPKPDVLVFNTNQCRDVQDWFKWYGKEYNAPVVGIHTYVGVLDVTDDYIPSIVMQIKQMIKSLEQIAEKKIDLDELKIVTALSRECSDLWSQVLATAAAKPSPLTFFDASTLMGAAVVGRGTEQANTCYKNLLKELKERISNNIGAVEKEQFRIYWDGMPVWGRLKAHSELFGNLKACVLASTYCSSWIFSALDSDNPLESMARAYTELFIVRSDQYKEKYIKEMLEFFSIDGIIYHDAKTCPSNSNSRYGMPKRVEKETQIPSLIINGDLNDLRLLSDEQTRTNVEAFLEQLYENS
ncbi:MAG: 2-hydroxyacyl-CoA dehydratase family protein [Thermodesulfobacteriota bacterium]|nr:2-hydroxyacyl-CoA dehydratase family protein [Thermodesulfobacteriota bacterium]